MSTVAVFQLLLYKMRFMNTWCRSMEPNASFPVLLVGKIDDIDANVPFACLEDAVSYIRMLDWSIGSGVSSSVNVVVYENGEKKIECKLPTSNNLH